MEDKISTTSDPALYLCVVTSVKEYAANFHLSKAAKLSRVLHICGFHIHKNIWEVAIGDEQSAGEYQTTVWISMHVVAAELETAVVDHLIMKQTNKIEDLLSFEGKVLQ